MKNLKAKIAFGLVVVFVILGIAFEYQLRRFIHLQGPFVLCDIPLTDYAGRKERIDRNYRGFVIFYSDLIGCTACMSRLVNLSKLDKAYEEVGFYAISRKREEGQEFAQLMHEYDVPGVYLVDELRLLQSRLGLSDRPALLFFNKDGELLSAMPMDIEYENLKRHLHRLINEF